MNDIETDVWKRQGCSLVWEPSVLKTLMQAEQPHPLREVLLWLQTGFPSIPAHKPVFVAGLQTCLELLAPSPHDAETFLRQMIQPLIRHWQDDFPESGLIFGLNCDPNQWSFDASDCAILRLRPNLNIAVTAALWNGAARDAHRIMYDTTSTASRGKPGRAVAVFGGLYVRRLS